MKDEIQNLSKKHSWSGTHEGIFFEIVNWGFDNPKFHGETGKWNYYVYLDERRVENLNEFFLPSEVKQFSPGGTKYISYDYYKSPLSNVDWHGGVTFWEQYEDPYKRIKIGCDYSHYFDEDMHYDIETVLWECKHIIDELLPLLKIKKN